MKKLLMATLVLALGLVFTACGGDDDSGPSVTLVNDYNLVLSADNSVPAVFGRTETGIARLELFDNNTLKFSINVTDLNANDALTVAHLHAGDAVTAGPIIVGLVDNASVTFNENGDASGEITLTAAQMAQIQGEDVYVNVHSQNAPAGLVRGQVDVGLEFSKNIALSPSNQVPAVTGRLETGVAYVRIDDQDRLSYRIEINNLDPTDMITAGHIHNGDATENGDVLINLNFDQSNINQSSVVQLTPLEAAGIVAPSRYVNVHSQQQPAGLLRGQMVD